tara:strand:+ start:33974 stop:36625 length:2652 start_codon:yes stop_codon:yes gene_type:complete
MSKKDLPSINDYLGSNDLPSYKDLMGKKEVFPSVEEYISESNQNIIEEDTQTTENVDDGSSLEVVDLIKAPEWSELVRLVNDVRKNIPEIPEIKYYDTELCEISEKIVEIQENLSLFDVKSDKIYELDERNEELKVKLSEIESKIPQVPEIKYYDSDIESICQQIQQIFEGIENLPEIKQYDDDIQSLNEQLKEVKDRDVPDFRWIGNTFNTIDEDFEKVQGHLSSIKNKIESEVSELSETISVKEFEQNINVKNLSESLNESIKTTNSKLEETKCNIYSELSKSSLKIWEYHREFKDDDKKLKKSILGEQNKLKQSLKSEIKEFNEQSVKTDETLFQFFNNLKEEVSLLPKVKYYDDDISNIKDDIFSLKLGLKELNKISSLIKKDQKTLEENYLLNEPPSVKEKAGGQTDPITPLDQNFATLDDLSNHYRLFINRITTQLSTIGGGGETRLQYLDDIAGITTNINAYDGMVLQIDLSQTGEDKHKKFKFAPSGGGTGAGGTWTVGSAGIHTTKNVGIGATARTDFALHVAGDGQFTGNLSVGGTITYDDVTNIDSVGLITARTGIDVLAGGINVVGVSTISTGIGTIHLGVGSTTLLVDGDARVTGVLTIGQGSITLDPIAKKIEGIDEIIIGTATTVRIHQSTSGEISFSDREGKKASVGIGTTVSINTTGIITATNIVSIKSDDGTSGRLDLYCESNNVHYARLQAPDHGDFSGNPIIKLPATAGTLLLSDGSGASLTSLNASNLGSGTIPDARFPATLPASSGANLTGLTGASAATYGDASNVAAITVDANGRITGISEVTISGGGGSASDSFKTISVSGQSDVVADSATDTLTLVAGSNMTITTDASTDTITLASSGGGGGGGITAGKSIALAMVFG